MFLDVTKKNAFLKEKNKMTNREKYDAAFIEVFDIEHASLDKSLEYQSITAWDSV